jgi:hypothetical protein
MQVYLKRGLFFGVLALVLGAGTTMAFSRIILPDGAVSSPSLTFGNDLNTGMYRSDAGTVGVVVHGHDSAWFLDGANASLNVSSGNTSLNGVAMCATTVASDCDLAKVPVNPGLYLGQNFVYSITPSNPTLCGDLFVLADPLVFMVRGGTNAITLDSTQTVGANTGSFQLSDPFTLMVGASGVSGSSSRVQVLGTVASDTPSVPFSIGPTAAVAASSKLGSFICTQRCKVTKGWGKALTAGTGGTTAPTMVVTDGTSTCTLTSASGCNVAVDTDESFTASGTCSFAAAARLNVSATRGNCTVFLQFGCRGQQPMNGSMRGFFSAVVVAIYN